MNINLYGLSERKYSIYKFANHFNDFRKVLCLNFQASIWYLVSYQAPLLTPILMVLCLNFQASIWYLVSYQAPLLTPILMVLCLNFQASIWYLVSYRVPLLTSILMVLCLNFQAILVRRARTTSLTCVCTRRVKTTPPVRGTPPTSSATVCRATRASTARSTSTSASPTPASTASARIVSTDTSATASQVSWSSYKYHQVPARRLQG